MGNKLKTKNVSATLALALCSVFLVATVLIVAGAGPAWALDTASGADCIEQVPDIGSITCAANDVRIAKLQVVGDPVTCDPNSPDPVEVTLKATILSGPERYDIGLWVNETGGSARNDPDGTCFRAILAPQGTYPTDTTKDCDSVSGPYANGDNDSCGDIPKTSGECTNTTVIGTDLVTEYTFTASLACVDTNGDGTVDTGACTSWSQNPDEIICGDVLDAIPGSPSKCECDSVDIGGFYYGCQVDADCDDGIACTNDICTVVGNVGTCSNTPDNTVCDDSNVCTEDMCAPDDPDALVDTGCVNDPVDPNDFPQCSGGECVPELCDTDGNECTSGSCNEDGTCADPVPVDDSTPCEDGFFCTSETGTLGTPDHCESGVCVGIPVDCGPGDQCNTNVCNDETDACVFVPVAESTPCTDSNACTAWTGVEGDPDHCDGAGACVGVPVDCSGLDDACNDGVCDPTTGACGADPKAESTICDDGNACTAWTAVEGDPDHCDGAGACVGVPVNCSGLDDACNDGVCDPTTGACGADPKAESTICDDGNACTAWTAVEGDPDHCDGAGACVGVPVNCSGLDDACNDGVCDPTTGACGADPKAESTICDDGNACTAWTAVEGDPDHCDGAGACVGVPVNCSGLDDACNDGVCDPTTGACGADPKAESTICDDGNACTAWTAVEGDPDHCDGAGACVGVPVNCSGLDDACNDGVCDPTTGACGADPKAESTICDDGNACTAWTAVEGDPDHCDGAGACVGVPVDCSGLDDACNDGVCDPTTGACGADPKAESTICDDGNACTAWTAVEGDPDHCDGAGACVGVPVDCSGLDDDCKDGVCDPATGACYPDPWDEGTSCGSDADNACTDPDTCDDAGNCLPNNTPCSDVTSSSLCPFDVDPGACGSDYQNFRVLFTPDVQNWVAYKQSGTNPGQYYYNLIYNGSAGDTVRMVIPWPFVTQGARALHVYDASHENVIDEFGCFNPCYNSTDACGALSAEEIRISLEDWASGGSNAYGVTCDQVIEPNGEGNCYFDVMLPEHPDSVDCDADGSCSYYVNIHLDWGIKGNNVDANPAEGTTDRYDIGMHNFASYDADVDTDDDSGELALPNCREFTFCHDTDLVACSSADPDSFDVVQNVNSFKNIAGAFGRVIDGVDGISGLEMLLVNDSTGKTVKSSMTDDDGYYTLVYKHKGKPTTYHVEVIGSVLCYPYVQDIELQGNGWSEVNFDTSDCSSTSEYGSGRNKTK